MSSPGTRSRPTVFAVWLVLAGVVGWWAAYSLLIERFEQLETPGTSAGCDFSVIVQCTANLSSWQGSVFGFPNPVLGVAAWIAPIVVGMALLAGAKFARWFWFAFAAGITFAFGFVLWLIGQSIFVLGTLCPWCMVTWTVTIPTFYAVWLHLLRSGVLPGSARMRRTAAGLMSWVPLMAILSYVVIAVMAQLRLDFIGSF